jgi:L-alanine-DL-glutamate epimerase-like enolase superfamily enzyme
VKITAVESWREAVPLTRPYEIASMRIDSVDLFFLRIRTDCGVAGLGSASPAEDVTGESPEASREALSHTRLEWLGGRDPRRLGELLEELTCSHRGAPAARAAIDMALHDLVARIEDVPLVDLFGRCHEALPTSVTIGITSVEATLAEAEEHLDRGFRCLKVKTGRSLDEDRERLAKLRERVGPDVGIRIDANQGCSVDQLPELAALALNLDLELIEQPLHSSTVHELRLLPPELRRLVAADESLIGEEDARALAEEPVACGIFNIKLMKCGGIRPGLGIAEVAHAADIDLMWGCNDESVLSITAALHAAYACPRTRHLDLDGSFDLARDPAMGGFEVEHGMLRLLDRPGLGVDLAG